jgi:hypothetical protein
LTDYGREGVPSKPYRPLRSSQRCLKASNDVTL